MPALPPSSSPPSPPSQGMQLVDRLILVGSLQVKEDFPQQWQTEAYGNFHFLLSTDPILLRVTGQEDKLN